MPNPCIEEHAPQLADRYNKLVGEGMSDREAALKVALEEHKDIFDELNKLKNKVGIKLSKEEKTYVSPESKANPEDANKIHAEYDKKISALKPEQIKNSEAKKEIISEQPKPTEDKGSISKDETEPTIEPETKKETPKVEEQVKDKFKTIADKIRKGKISDDIAMSGIPFAKEIWNKSIDIVADAVELTGDIVKAVEEGVKYIKSTDWYKNLTAEQQKRAEERFQKEFEENAGEDGSSPLIDIKSFSEIPNKTERVRGAYEHLMDSDMPEDVKQKFKDEGITYQISKNEGAQKVGKSVIDAFGADEAVKLARLNTFSPSVNSAVYSEAINHYYNAEKAATLPADKFKAAQQWANLYNEYAEKLTASGQFGQYAYQFYKTSPLGFILSAKERLDERREYFVAKDEKKLRELYEQFKDVPEFKDLFAKEVKEAAKKVKHEIKEANRKKISDAFDKLKLDTNNTYATFVPPTIINGAIEAMKQAVLLGYEVADVIAEGVKYINSNHKDGWNEEQFKKDFEPKIKSLIDENVTTHKGRLEQYKTLLRGQIKSIDNQILNNSRKIKPEKLEHDEETIQLRKERKEKLEQLNKLLPTEDTAKKILDKWDKKLTKLEPTERKELLSKVLNEIVKNGGLEYSKFKDMYADALGLPKLTPEMEKKLHTLGEKLNSVDIAKENIDKAPTPENIAAFKKALSEGEVASREINDLLGDKGITLDRFLSIAKLNTLGVANLFINPFFNVWFMPVRFLEGVLKTGLDYGLKYSGFERTDGIYENTFYKQRGYVKGFGTGITKAVKNIYTGDAQFDYFQKTTRQNIRPIDSFNEILAHHRGEKKLTTSEYANAVMESFPTIGGTAAIISRGLQLGDLPFRFAAERGTAESIAKQKGLTGVKKEAFILNPDEVSATKIRDAGERAVMAQDNLLTSSLTTLSNYLKNAVAKNPAGKVVLGAGKVIGGTTQPFLKIPLNSAMTAFELAVPEFSLIRGIYHAVQGNRDMALSSFSRAAVGYGIGLAFSQLGKAGLVTTTSDDDKKVNTSIYQGDVVGSQSLNYTGFKRYLRGGSPEFKDGDVTVNLNWMGLPGSIMQMYGQRFDKMPPTDWDKQGYFSGLTERMDASFVNGLKNNVFGNTSTLFNAMDNGGQYYVNKWLRGSTNVLANAFEPSWLATAGKLSDSYKPDYSAMNLKQQLAATFKERFADGSSLPSQITVWGEKRHDAPEGSNPYLYYYADITKHRNVNTDDFGYNILALYNKTKQDAAIPSRPEKTIRQNKTSFKLSPEQYEDFQVMVGQNRKQLTKALMSTPKFNDATDDEKIKMLKNVYSDGYDIGKLELEFKYYDLFKQNDALDEKTTKAKLKREIKKAK